MILKLVIINDFKPFTSKFKRERYEQKKIGGRDGHDRDIFSCVVDVSNIVAFKSHIYLA